MGNQVTIEKNARPASESITELTNITLKESLGGGRVLKTFLCVHDDGLVVVKVHQRKSDMDLTRQYNYYTAMREALKNLDYQHISPYQIVQLTPKAGYLVRQYIYSNLHDRLTTRPFLTRIEKLWITFQLLHAVQQLHQRGYCHGDIKSGNVLVTSWNWVFLTDMAAGYKPVMLPAENPVDFSFFYDVQGKRVCYIAPERFYDGSKDPQQGGMQLQPSMDIFSLGCVIAELYLDGKDNLRLSQLLQYRKGEYDPMIRLEGIGEPKIQRLIQHMTQLNPENRMSAEQYLYEFEGGIFPEHFHTLLHPFFDSLLRLDSESRVKRVKDYYQIIRSQLTGEDQQAKKNKQENSHNSDLNSGDTKVWFGENFKSLASEKVSVGISKIGAPDQSTNKAGDADFERQQNNEEWDLVTDIQTLRTAVSKLEQRLENPQSVEELNNQSKSGLPGSPFIEQQKSGMPQGISAEGKSSTSRTSADDSFVLVTVLLCTMVCGAKQQDSKLAAVRMLYDAACLCDEDIRLQRAIPYLLAAASGGIGSGGLMPVGGEDDKVSNDSAKVKCVALRSVVRLLRSIQCLPVSDARIFAEYIMPSLSLLPGNDEEIVRVEYACALPKLASTAHRFLMRVQFLHSQQEIPEGFAPGVSYDQELEKLRTAMAQIIMDMLQSQSMSSSDNKEQLASSAAQGMLQYLDSLALFFGSSDADLMPVIISLLNHSDWQLRASFYRHIIRLAPVKGPRALMHHILPLLDNALSDPVYEVATQAVSSVTYLVATGGLDKPTLLLLAKKFLPFLGYSPSCLRASALALLAAIAVALPAADTYARLLPVAEHYFLQPPLALEDVEHLVDYLTPQEDVKEAEGQRTINDIPKSHLQYTMQMQRGGSIQQYSMQYNNTSPKLVPKHAMGAPTYVVAVDEEQTCATLSRHRSAVLNVQKKLAEQEIPSAIQTDYIGTPSTFAQDFNKDTLPSSSFNFSNRQVEQSSSAPAAFQGNMKSIDASIGNRVVQTNVINQLSSSNEQQLQQQQSPDELTTMLMLKAKRKENPIRLAQGTQYTQILPINSSQTVGDTNNSSVTDKINEAMEQALDSRLAGVDSQGSHWTVDTLVRGGGWKPRGVLIGHMAEHRGAVNRIAVCSGGDFFASASNDGDVKIWDCRRLEHVITFQSRFTYSGHRDSGRVVAVTFCDRLQSVASASNDGSIHLWRVEYYAKSDQNQSQNVFTGYQAVSEIQKKDEGGITELLNWGPLLLYSTQQGVYAYDPRIEKDVWSLKSVAREGIVRRMAGDPTGCTWIVTGTSQGVCTLWDVRFQLPVHVWVHPSGKPVESLLPAIAPAQKLGLQKGDEELGPLLYLTCGGREIELWSLQERRCVQVLRCADSFGGHHSGVHPFHVPGDAPQALTYQPQQGIFGKAQQGLSSDSTALYNHLKLPSLQEIPRYKKWGVRALLPFTDGPLLSAGTDKSIRYWDAVHVDKSYMVCAPPVAHDTVRPGGVSPLTTKHQYQTRMYANVPVVEERILTDEPNIMSPSSSTSSGRGGNMGSRNPSISQSARELEQADIQHMQRACHSDAILHMAVVELSDKVLLSAGRDGVVKAWK